jgi:hypothetical protein
MHQPTQLPMVAAILLIIGFIAGLVGAVEVFIYSSFAYFIGMEGIFLFCGSLLLIFSLMNLIAAVFAFQRKNWTGALVCSILGIFSIGVFGMGSIMAIIGMILIAVSKNDFQP